MTKTRRSSLLFAIGFAACFSATHSLADHLPDSKLAQGESESLLCGVKPAFTAMNDILSKLGEPRSIEPRKEDKVNVTYQWSRGPLLIQVNTYQYGDYLNRNPVSVEVEGSDPDGFCRTGRGLKLEDSLADLQRLYGERYSVRKTGKGKREITIQWSDLTTLYVFLSKDGHVEAIELSGDTE